jgi:hypothetical protein
MMATIDSTTSSATAAAAVTIKADNQGVLVSPSTLSSTNTDNTKKHDGVATAALTDVEVEGDVNADTTKKTPAPAVQATTTPLVMEKEKQHVDTTSTKSTAVTLITTTTTTTTTEKDHRSSSTSPPIIKENEIITSTLNDMDVLCGRGKGIRNHPGNILYNKLLRERYEEYGTAPKGSKLSIVNIVVNTIRNQQQLNGGGRFLEQKQQEDSNSLEDSDVYIDIGDVRALNKTVSTYLY